MFKKPNFFQITISINLIFFLIFLNSCKKTEKPVISEEPAIIAEEFFKGNMDLKPFNYSYITKSDSFLNTYFWGINQNQINIGRFNTSYDKLLLIIFSLNKNLDSIQMPATFPGNNGYFDIQWIDYKNLVDTMFSKTDNINYASTYGKMGVKLTITGKTLDFLMGTFSGDIGTGTGDIKIITNGEFKIRINRKHN